MKVLVLMGRYTAGRDIVSEDFGRQVRLFGALKNIGHDIDFFCADYRKLETKDAVLHGIRVFIRPFSLIRLPGFLLGLGKIISKESYDIVVATSDPLWGAIGYYFAKKYSKRFLYDLHDNYETYSSYKILFLKSIDRHVMKNAQLLTTVSQSLKKKVSKLRNGSIFVIENGVDLEMFRPLDKTECRRKLGLAADSTIIAYTGSIQTTLGVDILISAFERLPKKMNVKLLLVGRLGFDSINSKTSPDIKREGIISFDTKNQRDVSLAINAADVVAIPSPKNEFSRYCFPYKLLEYMACNTPIVATRIGDCAAMLREYKDSLCRPGDIDDLCSKILIQSKKGKIEYRKKIKKLSWGKIALKFSSIIEHNSIK